MVIENKTDKKIQNILSTLSDYEKDRLYRSLWYDHVVQDIHSRLEDISDPDDPEDRYAPLTEDNITHIAYRYVYNGDYDCNLDYWTNLENLIDETVDSKKE